MVRPLDRHASEAQFAAAVLEVATLGAWVGYHTWNSQHSAKGFPDLILMRPARLVTGTRLVAAELKREGLDPTVEQRIWLDLFDGLPGGEAYLWWPSDMDDVEQRLLRDAAPSDLNSWWGVRKNMLHNVTPLRGKTRGK